MAAFLGALRRTCALRCAESYSAMFARVVGASEMVYSDLDLPALMAAPGAPSDPVQCFLDITQRSKLMLVDKQVDWFLQQIYVDVYEGRMPCDVGIGKGVQVLECAEAAGHLPGGKTYLKLMKIAFELREDEGRRLVLDLFFRLQRRLKVTNVSSGKTPAPGACLLALKAGANMRPAPRAELREIINVVENTLCRNKQIMQANPALWAAVYTGWRVVDPEQAERSFDAAVASRTFSSESFATFIKWSPTVSDGVAKFRAMQQHGFAASSRVYNSLILIAAREGDPRRPHEEVRDEMAGLMQNMVEDGVAVDDQTLGCLVSVFRRHDMGQEAYAAVQSLRATYGCTPTRNTLTSVIAAQIAGCGDLDPAVSAEHVRYAEEAMVEIFERDLVNTAPAARAHHCFGRLMQCYARAGDVAKLEALRDGFAAHIRGGKFTDDSQRFNRTMQAAYHEAYLAAAARAVHNPRASWGGTLHAPWVPANADASLQTSPPPAHMSEMWP